MGIEALVEALFGVTVTAVMDADAIDENVESQELLAREASKGLLEDYDDTPQFVVQCEEGVAIVGESQAVYIGTDGTIDVQEIDEDGLDERTRKKMKSTQKLKMLRSRKKQSGSKNKLNLKRRKKAKRTRLKTARLRKKVRKGAHESEEEVEYNIFSDIPSELTADFEAALEEAGIEFFTQTVDDDMSYYIGIDEADEAADLLASLTDEGDGDVEDDDEAFDYDIDHEPDESDDDEDDLDEAGVVTADTIYRALRNEGDLKKATKKAAAMVKKGADKLLVKDALAKVSRKYESAQPDCVIAFEKSKARDFLRLANRAGLDEATSMASRDDYLYAILPESVAESMQMFFEAEYYDLGQKKEDYVTQAIEEVMVKEETAKRSVVEAHVLTTPWITRKLFANVWKGLCEEDYVSAVSRGMYKWVHEAELDEMGQPKQLTKYPKLPHNVGPGSSDTKRPTFSQIPNAGKMPKGKVYSKKFNMNYESDEAVVDDLFRFVTANSDNAGSDLKKLLAAGLTATEIKETVHGCIQILADSDETCSEALYRQAVDSTKESKKVTDEAANILANYALYKALVEAEEDSEELDENVVPRVGEKVTVGEGGSVVIGKITKVEKYGAYYYIEIKGRKNIVLKIKESEEDGGTYGLPFVPTEGLDERGMVKSPGEKVALELLDYHGGGGSGLYAAGSTWLAKKPVPARELKRAFSEMDAFAKSKYGDARSKKLAAMLKKMMSMKESISEGRPEGTNYKKGQTITVEPTPRGVAKSNPAAKWLTKTMKVRLLEPAVSGTLDVFDVKLPNGDEESIYGFNIKEDLNEAVKEGTSEYYFNKEVLPALRKVLRTKLPKGCKFRGRGRVNKKDGSVTFIVDCPNPKGPGTTPVEVIMSGSYMSADDGMFDIYINGPSMPDAHSDHEKFKDDVTKDVATMAASFKDLMADVMGMLGESLNEAEGEFDTSSVKIGKAIGPKFKFSHTTGNGRYIYYTYKGKGNQAKIVQHAGKKLMNSNFPDVTDIDFSDGKLEVTLKEDLDEAKLPPDDLKGLKKWVADYDVAWKSGAVKMAKAIKSNVDKRLKQLKVPKKAGYKLIGLTFEQHKKRTANESELSEGVVEYIIHTKEDIAKVPEGIISEDMLQDMLAVMKAQQARYKLSVKKDEDGIIGVNIGLTTEGYKGGKPHLKKDKSKKKGMTYEVEGTPELGAVLLQHAEDGDALQVVGNAFTSENEENRKVSVQALELAIAKLETLDDSETVEALKALLPDLDESTEAGDDGTGEEFEDDELDEGDYLTFESDEPKEITLSYPKAQAQNFLRIARAVGVTGDAKVVIEGEEIKLTVERETGEKLQELMG